jgi:signal transduction histidine kinase
MPTLRTGSLRAKLFAIVMITTTSALVITALPLTLFELSSYRSVMSREVTALAMVIGANASTALAQDDRSSADEILAAAALLPDVLSACLYDRNDGLFARFLRSGHAQACPPHPEATGVERRPAGILIRQPVLLKGTRVGTLRLFSHLGELRRRVNLHLIVLVIVLLAASLVAVLISTRLQRVVLVPIVQLADTAKNISHKHDYGLRAEKHNEDEIGAAVDAFNQMLERIEQADAAVRGANASLEVRIQERTAALQEQAKELRRSNEQLEAFAYVASHDLQEPLRAIASYAQLLRIQLEGSTSEADVYIGFVLEGVARMRELIKALLDYARLDVVSINFRPTALDDVLTAALADLAATIKEERAEVVRQPLPVLSIERVQLGQVFSNLIANAIRYRRKDTPPRIEIDAEHHDDEWRFSVRDNGIGIDPKHHKRIFVIFQRLHGRDRPGTGIGLAVCKKIVESHGGRIWVESAPAAGATFFFTLPTRLPVRAAESAPARTENDAV